ncbi:hypothetical protein ACFU5O_28165 [Streptomyces sp. NPDC057445]|uniref:hypothetical protein n=1 Tax=Streptomyces sp. NPDC057445 TaxID=3346136 RepID=UPI00368F9B94
MINEEFRAPQHELNVISSLLQDRRVAYDQLVDWRRREPQYWLLQDHFKTSWLGEIYGALLAGGLNDIEQRLQAYPNADPAQVIADAVTARLAEQYQAMAATGVPGAQEKLRNADHWANVHRIIRQLAKPTWPATTSHTRHEAYVVVRSAQHASTTQGVPFELTRGRPYDDEARLKELAVIGAILNDPRRIEQFLYTPSSPDASPYWLQPQDFGDPATAEIWDALVTGPDPAIALPAATDPRLTPEQRAQAMIEHIYYQLSYNDYHRAAADPEAQARLHNHTNQAIAAYLAQASRPDFSPNPDNASLYAVHSILEPSIPAAVANLAGEVRRDGLADASLYQVAMQLSTHEHALDQLQERLDAAPRTLAGDSMQDQTEPPEPGADDGPSYAARDIERRVLISLMQRPAQLREGGWVQSLGEQDFTQHEHAYLFKAIQSLPEHAAQDPWILANQAVRLARYEGAPALNLDEVNSIAHAARTIRVAPAEQEAGHLAIMTVRRVARDASTVIEASAQQTRIDPRQLIKKSRMQVHQATQEAWRHHEQSVPDPSRYATHRAGVG